MSKEITALFDKNNKVIMDWSPKGGCTILIKMFFRNMGLLEEALQYNSWIHEYRMHVFSKEQPTTIQDITDSNIYKFKVVRNPYKRAVSSYIHTMKYESMHEVVRKTLWKWNANISFKSFVKYLGKIDINNCDPHYSLQKKYYEYDFPNCFNRIIKLEELSSQLELMNLEQGFQFNLEGLESGHHVKKNIRNDDLVMKKKWSKIESDIPDYPNFYDDELIEKVNQIYRQDFDSYGYTKDDFPK